MRILLTGGTGFLGAYVCQKLLENGHLVTVCYREGSKLDRLEALTRSLRNKPNLVAYELVDLSAGYDAVIHTATEYGRGSASFSKVIEANIAMPVRLLEKCDVHGIGIFLNVDSYYFAAGINHPLSSYILSKRHFIDWAKAIAQTRIKAVNMRIEHLYGPMDSASKFCTSIVRDCIQGKERISLTHGNQLRDFIYVEDAARAFSTVIEHLRDFEVGWSTIGVGSGRTIPLKEFVLEVHRLTNSKSELGFGDLAQASGEITESKADTAFLSDKGWQCRTSLQEGIMEVIKDVRRQTSSMRACSDVLD
jgi:CDP-paratose synthetase